MHAFHKGLSGYHPNNVLHDGCDECEERAAAGLDGLCHLDDRSFTAIWRLMLDVKWSGGPGVDRPVSACDLRLASTCYLIGVLLERSAKIDPRVLLGQMEAHSAELRASLGLA